MSSFLTQGHLEEQPEQGSDSQTWVLGLGALALVGAAAARATQASSSVAALDEEDLEVARVATLAVKGKKEEPWSLTSFLMGGRKSFRGENTGELELLSGVLKPKSDEPGQLASRFKIGYDTRARSAAKAKAKPKAKAKAAKSKVDARFDLEQDRQNYSELAGLPDLCDPDTAGQDPEGQDAVMARAHLAASFLNCYGTKIARNEDKPGWQAEGNMSEAALKVAVCKGGLWDGDRKSVV